MKITCSFVNFWVGVLLIQVYIACYTEAMTNNVTDQTALLALKDHVSYEPNNVLTNNWSTIAPFCSWVGVTCDARQRVTKLDFSNMGLEGTIPSQIGNLSFLAFLSIRNNSFYGSLPNELTQLTQLKILDFGFNHFSGTIPSSLLKCEQLQILSLSYNNLAGSIPAAVGNLTMLKKLYLDHNNFSGMIVPFFPFIAEDYTLFLILFFFCASYRNFQN
ncbi:hypothetical protein JCGZ_26310 [Jatropha curcas]|uniref:Leucine-rich repeat-containing N-terminal plant-type domain-containing protein n=1 Tax=Jatropha curcas TaxID=180498 RepID=A0A067JSF6_JATCU|nr:hypothetical protein JCGZ_26310 [Jatropha curcas]